jgi:hypothetical protein
LSEPLPQLSVPYREAYLPITTSGLIGQSGHVATLSEGKTSFCVELRRTEPLVAELRVAAAARDTARCAVALDAIGDVLVGLDPPPELASSLPVAISYFRFAANAGRVVALGWRAPKRSAADRALDSIALQELTLYAIRRCGARMGQLIP